MAHRLLNRSPPTHFFFFNNQILIAYFRALKGFKRVFKRYLKEKTRAPEAGLWITFPVRLPPDPPKGVRFAHVVFDWEGCPSQTIPGGEERTATSGTDGGNATEKPKDGLQNGGATRAAVLNSPVEAHRKARKRQNPGLAIIHSSKENPPERRFGWFKSGVSYIVRPKGQNRGARDRDTRGVLPLSHRRRTSSGLVAGFAGRRPARDRGGFGLGTSRLAGRDAVVPPTERRIMGGPATIYPAAASPACCSSCTKTGSGWCTGSSRKPRKTPPGDLELARKRMQEMKA